MIEIKFKNKYPKRYYYTYNGIRITAVDTAVQSVAYDVKWTMQDCFRKSHAKAKTKFGIQDPMFFAEAEFNRLSASGELVLHEV